MKYQNPKIKKFLIEKYSNHEYIKGFKVTKGSFGEINIQVAYDGKYIADNSINYWEIEKQIKSEVITFMNGNSIEIPTNWDENGLLYNRVYVYFRNERK